MLSAYKDNAAVVAGADASWFWPDAATGVYGYSQEPAHLVMKVETHNHPTAISPFPGAATGSGGEIRDEGATGRGAKPKAGLVGFTVSHLELPGWRQPWERSSPGKPDRIASPLAIMLEGPIGAASFNNEFGRPNLAGYFRTSLLEANGVWRGYHKPIMIAGGVGNIRGANVVKGTPGPGAKLVVLGGPAMLIGLGGGAASSQGSGAGEAELDFASVQRGNAEMQRRAQEVIDACWALAKRQPDRGDPRHRRRRALERRARDRRAQQLRRRDRAACDSERRARHEPDGAVVQRIARALHADDRGPRYRTLRGNLCARARSVRRASASSRRNATSSCATRRCGNTPVAMPMDVLFGKPPKMLRRAASFEPKAPEWRREQLSFPAAVDRVLAFPAVADKSFLIHIGDRTVGGLVSRDQLVGPWQVPVSDVAVTAAGYAGYSGEALAMGERTPVAIHNGPASARLAVAEAVLNIAAADVAALADIRLSANWMAAAGHGNDDYALYAMVRAVGEELCPALGLAVPVGKDSLSMRTVWQDDGRERAVTAPVSLIVSAFAPVADIRRTLTPELRRDVESVLVFVDLAAGAQRLGGSALAQTFGQFGGAPPDVDDPQRLLRWFAAQRALRAADLALAYHDRSDGGLFTTLVEMAFAANVGLDVELDRGVADAIAYLFNEELGAVIQVPAADLTRVEQVLGEQRIAHCVIARIASHDDVVVRRAGSELYRAPRVELRRKWSELTFRMQALRDDPQCAREAFDAVLDVKDPGLNAKLTFALPNERRAAARAGRPKVAVLREQGVNGQREMAATLDRAGFEAHDVHMTDLLTGRKSLEGYRGVVACGGFSYGDVLGAGEGWAKTILYHERARPMFAEFFARSDAFALGVCNGCQMLAALKELIPGTQSWPKFLRNRSDQFEARLTLVEIVPSPSILLAGMAGSRLPIVTAHGEGRAEFKSAQALADCDAKLTAMRFVTNDGAVAERYPANPNGSPRGMAGLSNADGRVTIMMPHPERVFRTVQMSWHPQGWGECSPWQRLFDNARAWV